jgi:hypothetical protein
MGLQRRSTVFALICGILLTGIPFSIIDAQNNSNVKEPPIPVYEIIPYHPDSLSAPAEGVAQSLNTLSNTNKKLDTLQLHILTSSAESTVHFIWLYTLVALLGIMNIVLLFSISRVRFELAQMKRMEQQQLHKASESSAMPQQPAPRILEPLHSQESNPVKAPARTRKSRTTKPRVKKQK